MEAVPQSVKDFHAEASKCDACGAMSRGVPNATLRWVCAACGAPRVYVPAPRKARELLTEAHELVKQEGPAQAKIVIASIVIALGGILGIAFMHNMKSQFIVGFAVIFAIVQFVTLLRKGIVATRNLARAKVDEAWSVVIAETRKANPKLTVEALADQFHTTMRDVEVLLEMSELGSSGEGEAASWERRIAVGKEEQALLEESEAEARKRNASR